MKKQLIVLTALLAVGSSQCSLFDRMKQSASSAYGSAKDKIGGMTTAVQNKWQNSSLRDKFNSMRTSFMRNKDNFTNKARQYANNLVKPQEMAKIDYAYLKENYDFLAEGPKSWANGVEPKLLRGTPLTPSERDYLVAAVQEAFGIVSPR